MAWHSLLSMFRRVDVTRLVRECQRKFMTLKLLRSAACFRCCSNLTLQASVQEAAVACTVPVCQILLLLTVIRPFWWFVRFQHGVRSLVVLKNKSGMALVARYVMVACATGRYVPYNASKLSVDTFICFLYEEATLPSLGQSDRKLI